MSCETLHGVCQKCYGADLTTNDLIDVGEAVGTVAAQAIGEPGTQLSMNTKHAGGSASVGGDITQGLPRVEEVFENRAPKNPAVIAHVSGTISEIREEGREKTIIILPDAEQKASQRKKETAEYLVQFRRMPLVSVGDHVERGQLLTDGSANIDELYEYAGKDVTQNYIINETNKIYELQGVTISRKHLEVIAKQMFSRFEIADPGDTPFSEGDLVEDWNLGETNARVEEKGGVKAAAKQTVLGITEVSLHRKSFLSAASFQYTTRTLINAAVRGSVDHLTGLKENVIIGRLIPAGSGFAGSKKAKSIEALQAEESKARTVSAPQASAVVSTDVLAS
jgi:DNA-directed RNA polymerase subunit beta'